MSAAGKRLVGVAICAVVVCVLIGLYIGLYLTTSPGDASAAAVAGPNGTNLYLATVAASETTDPHPSWVSYYVVDAKDQNWHHATTFELPANSLVHVTIYQFDGQSGLRNPFIAPGDGDHRRHVRAQRQAHGGDRSRRRLAHLRDPADGRVRSAVRHP